MAKGKLNEKQELFCKEYMIDLNATQAAIRAGYSQKTAYSIGHDLLKVPEVRTRIENLIQERSQRTLIHADFVIENLKEVSQRCLQKVPVMEFDPVDRVYKQKIDEDGNHVWSFDSIGANRSLELLGKHLKLFTDKTEESGKKELVVKVKYADRGAGNTAE